MSSGKNPLDDTIREIATWNFLMLSKIVSEAFETNVLMLRSAIAGIAVFIQSSSGGKGVPKAAKRI